MDITITKRYIQHLKRKTLNKIRSNKGLTMVELLCATLIMLLVSAGMVSGVQLAQRQYLKSVRNSEAQVLYSTIQAILTNELRYTTHVQYTDNGTNEVATFYSVTYAVKHHDTALVSLNKNSVETDYGELALGYDGEYNRILGSASYPNGLGARARLEYDRNNKIFTVYLTISFNNRPYLEEQSFQVMALNNVRINDE